MGFLAVWFLAVGTCDVVRGNEDQAASKRLTFAVVAGMGVAVLALLGLGVKFAPACVAGILTGLPLGLWSWSSQRAVRGEMTAVVPLAAVSIPIILLMSLSGVWHATPRQWLLDWFNGLQVPALKGVSLVAFLLGSAVLLVLLNTSNVVVRIVLQSAKASASTGEKRLKGAACWGRWNGSSSSAWH